MNSHEKFVKKIISKLEQGAQQHPDQEQLVQQVMQSIHKRSTSRRQTWAFSGLALAAALTAVTFAPDLLTHSQQLSPEQINTVKLSPQMVEDLEMLSLLGVEKNNYGS